MKRIAQFAVLFVSLLAAPMILAHHGGGPLRITAILSLTGSASALGRPAAKLLDFEVEHENAAGGVLEHQVRLTISDDASDPARAAALANELANPKRTDVVIGGNTTGTSLAIARAAQKAGVPFIALGLSSRIVAPGRSFVFKTPPTDGMAIAAILGDMRKRGLRELVVLYVDDPFGRAARNEARLYTHPQGLGYREYRIRLVETISLASDGGDAAQRMKRVVAHPGRGVLIVAAGELAARATRAYRETGIAMPAYQTHAVACPAFLRESGAAAEGVRLPVPPLALAAELAPDDPARAPIEAFARLYRERYGEEPCANAGYARDAIGLVFKAMSRIEGSGFGNLRTALEWTTDYQGVTGLYHLHPSDHLGLAPGALRMAEVRGGRFVPVD